MNALTDAAQQLYQPTMGTMTSQLPTMGESLNKACCALASDCTLPRIDELISRLKTAEQSLTRLRLALATNGGPPDGPQI